VLEQLELADATDDPDERRARLGFVVVGAGYAGTDWTRRLRVGLDWAVAAAFPRDVAELGTLGHPEPLPSPERLD
jgi:NADH:ubiquinone reductase (H+-translocating)